MIRASFLPSAVLLLFATPLWAGQAAAARGARPATTQEPPEFTVPPKPVPAPPSQILKRFFENKAITAARKEIPGSVQASLDAISSFIKEDPGSPDFLFMRAAMACEAETTDPKQILADLTAAASAGGTPLMFKPRNLQSMKARQEFELGQYEQSMKDLDASIEAAPDDGAEVFNDGGVTARMEATHCVWSVPDLEALIRRFPEDGRPQLYLGLYRSVFLRLNHDTDPRPVIDAYNAAAKLNPTSVLPHFYLGLLQAYTLGGMLSMANAQCIDDIVPRTRACLQLDDITRLAIRHLTAALALDTRMTAAYAVRAGQLLRLKDYRQAIRDYDKVVELKPAPEDLRIAYNDRALAKMQLGQYQSAVQDFTQSIALGCEIPCGSFDNRADAYMKLGDYTHALADVTISISRTMSNAVFIINIDSFRRLYPEYDSVADDVIAEKLRRLFYPQMDYATYTKQFLIEAKMEPTFILVDLYLKRGDIYAKLGRQREAEAEYDRVTRVFPKFANAAFEMKNGKRVRVQP